jgi:hypothetical protein
MVPQYRGAMARTPTEAESATLPANGQEWSARWNETVNPPSDDDQSRTWDERVLDTREDVLEFLDEVNEARREGRSPNHGP